MTSENYVRVTILTEDLETGVLERTTFYRTQKINTDYHVWANEQAVAPKAGEVVDFSINHIDVTLTFTAVPSKAHGGDIFVQQDPRLRTPGEALGAPQPSGGPVMPPDLSQAVRLPLRRRR